MDAIAEQLGVSAPALFKRFGSKKDLMVAALAPEPPQWVWRLVAGPTDEDIRAQLLRLATEMDAFFADLIPCMMVLKEAGIAEQTLAAYTKERAQSAGFVPEDAAPFPVLVRNQLRNFLQSASERRLLHVPEPTVAAQLLLGGIQSRHFMRRITGAQQVPSEAAAYVSSLIDILFHGLKPIEGEGGASSQEDT